MNSRIWSWGLFIASCSFWALGWAGAFTLGQPGNPNSNAPGILVAWGLGAFLGGLWLILMLVRIAARIWFHEKARAAAK